MASSSGHLIQLWLIRAFIFLQILQEGKYKESRILANSFLKNLFLMFVLVLSPVVGILYLLYAITTKIYTITHSLVHEATMRTV